MERAIKEALKTTKDIPVGCVIELNGNIIAKAHNMREENNDVTAHAEILAIKQAQEVLNNWRLDNCTMYVTLEPCPMCCWAILQSRIKTVYFGSYNTKYGALGSALNLIDYSEYKTKVYGGIKETECDKILKDFFIKVRK